MLQCLHKEQARIHLLHLNRSYKHQYQFAICDQTAEQILTEFGIKCLHDLERDLVGIQWNPLNPNFKGPEKSFLVKSILC
jgi:hypothetical protein